MDRSKKAVLFMLGWVWIIGLALVFVVDRLTGFTSVDWYEYIILPTIFAGIVFLFVMDEMGSFDKIRRLDTGEVLIILFILFLIIICYIGVTLSGNVIT